MVRHDAIRGAGPRSVLLGLVAALLLSALALAAGCSECFGSVYQSGDRTIERRHERDRAFEDPEGSSEGR